MTDIPTWRGRRAPKLTHSYDAWANDPTTGARPHRWSGRIVAMLTVAMLAIWAAWLWR